MFSILAPVRDLQMLMTIDTTPEDFLNWRAQHPDAAIVIDDELDAAELVLLIDRIKNQGVDISEIISAVICGGSKLRGKLADIARHYSDNSDVLNTIATHGSTPIEIIDLLLSSDFSSVKEHARIAKISYFLDNGMIEDFTESFGDLNDLTIGERWIIAQHAGAPESTLKALMLDEEDFICSQADAQLKSRGL